MINETKEVKVTDTYTPDRRTFGGMIKQYDFEGRTSIGDMAKKIFADWRFDDTCKRISYTVHRCR